MWVFECVECVVCVFRALMHACEYCVFVCAENEWLHMCKVVCVLCDGVYLNAWLRGCVVACVCV